METALGPGGHGTGQVGSPAFTDLAIKAPDHSRLASDVADDVAGKILREVPLRRLDGELRHLDFLGAIPTATVQRLLAQR